MTVLALLLILILAFVKAGIDERDAFLCSAVHTNPDLEMGQCPAHQNNISWLVISAFGIAFVILGGGMYLLFAPAGSLSKRQFAAVDTSKLNDEEKAVYSLLKGEGGSLYQSQIMEKTGFSKAKVTRILDKLEHDDRILERKRRGMTNIVVLK